MVTSIFCFQNLEAPPTDSITPRTSEEGKEIVLEKGKKRQIEKEILKEQKEREKEGMGEEGKEGRMDWKRERWREFKEKIGSDQVKLNTLI